MKHKPPWTDEELGIIEDAFFRPNDFNVPDERNPMNPQNPLLSSTIQSIVRFLIGVLVGKLGLDLVGLGITTDHVNNVVVFVSVVIMTIISITWSRWSAKQNINKTPPPGGV